MAVVLWKKSLFDTRTVPPAELTPILLLANILVEILVAQPGADRTPPLAPDVALKLQLLMVTKALEVVLIPLDTPSKRQRSIWDTAKPELAVTSMPVVTLSK